MPLTDSQRALLGSIRSEWNRAERDIKIAEQVCNNIIIPAIKELRYGGRRIVEVLLLLEQEGREAEIQVLLDEACFDCHRARHDSIDAATAKIAIDVEIMVDSLGYDAILPVYPAFPQLIRSLRSVRAKIGESREQRENREAIYSVLSGADFPALVAAYDDLRGSEEMMKALAKKSRWNYFFGKWGFWVGLVGLIIGTIISLWSRF